MNDGNVFFEAWRSFVVELHKEWDGLIIIVSPRAFNKTVTLGFNHRFC